MRLLATLIPSDGRHGPSSPAMTSCRRRRRCGRPRWASSPPARLARTPDRPRGRHLFWRVERPRPRGGEEPPGAPGGRAGHARLPRPPLRGIFHRDETEDLDRAHADPRSGGHDLRRAHPRARCHDRPGDRPLRAGMPDAGQDGDLFHAHDARGRKALRPDRDHPWRQAAGRGHPRRTAAAHGGEHDADVFVKIIGPGGTP